MGNSELPKIKMLADSFAEQLKAIFAEKTDEDLDHESKDCKVDINDAIKSGLIDLKTAVSKELTTYRQALEENVITISDLKNIYFKQDKEGIQKEGFTEQELNILTK